MEDNRGERLLAELLADPRKFDDAGRAYDLLQSYFAGFPLETLRPLLQSQDEFIQRSAAFIASELGSQARSLVDDIVGLLASADLQVRYYAMEVLTVCCEGDQAEKFAHVARMLESEEEVLRALAMRLVSNADVSQLEAAARHFETSSSYDRSHALGLRSLALQASNVPSLVTEMIGSADPLTRRYGAIAAGRLHSEYPQLLMEVGRSEDADLQRFAHEQLKVHMA